MEARTPHAGGRAPVPLPVHPGREAGVLWRVSAFGRQRVGAGQRYWWENEGREPAGRVVVQRTLAGTIRFRAAGGSEQAVGPGALMLFAYGEPTAYGEPRGPVTEPYACAWVCLDGAGLLDHVAAFRARYGSVIGPGPDPLLGEEIGGLIELARPGAATPPTALAGAVHRWVLRLFETAEAHRVQQLSPVERAVDFLERYPHQVVGLEVLAGRYGCSREALSRRFRARVGEPAIAYMNRAKTRRALRLLAQTDLPLADVAAQAGFPSGKTMRRHVQQATGLAPGRWRGSGEDATTK